MKYTVFSSTVKSTIMYLSKKTLLSLTLILAVSFAATKASAQLSVGISAIECYPRAPVVVGHGAVGGVGSVMQVVGGTECLIKLAVEVVELVVAVACGLKIDKGDEAAVGLEAEVLMLKTLQAEDEETGCAEESD